MANGKEVNGTQVLVGTVETAVNPLLEIIGGFTSEECVNAIKNNTMRGAVKAYATATMKSLNCDWDRAKAINRMTDEARKEFGTDTRVAEFLGLRSKSEFSKLRRAGALAVAAEKQGIKNLPPLTVVTEMLVLEGKKYGEQNLIPILEYVSENEMSMRETRDYVKTFEKPSKKSGKKAGKVSGKKSEKQDGKSESENYEELIFRLELTVDTKRWNGLSDAEKDEVYGQLNSVLGEWGLN